MSILDSSASSGASAIDPIAAAIKNPFSTTVKNNGERPNDFPGGFQITEYVNGKPNAKTALKLVGNLMPFQPFEWDGEQRLVKEYYPGNPEPAVQVLGPKEGPLIIKGRFKDKRYRDMSYYGVSYQYNLAINEMRKRGNLVKFGMTGAAGSWIRWGFIERGKFRMNKLSWIDYEIEFFVVGEKMPVNNYFAAKEKQAPGAVNQNLINQAASFQSTYSAIPKTMPQSVGDVLNGIINGVAKNINLVTGLVNTIVSAASDIEKSAFRAIGLVKNVRAQIAVYRRQIGGIASDFSHLSTDGGAPSVATNSYNNYTFINETSAGLVPVADYLKQLQSQFEAIALTVPKARYLVKTGDNLQTISVKFYGIPDNWEAIYNHNNLQSTQLVSGTVLEIPNV